MQILADRIEFCWIHLRGIGTLENSLWGYDGQGIRVWLNALAIEAVPPQTEDGSVVLDHVKESVNIPLDFYPLCMSPLSPADIQLSDGKPSRAHGQGYHHRGRSGGCHEDQFVLYNV